MIKIFNKYFIYTIPIFLSLFPIFTNQDQKALFGEEIPNKIQAQSTIRIAFTGEENGYLEPCGCSDTELGGLSKRHTLINLLRKNDENCILLSLGDLTKEVGRQDEIKMEIALKALDQMGYLAHNIGEKDIDMGFELLSYLSQISNVNFISSNIVFKNSQGLNVKPYVIKQIETEDTILRIGILGILSPKLVDDSYLDVEVLDPVESLKPLLNILIGETDFLLLLSHAEIDDSIRLAEIFPEFNLIITGHKVDNPEIYIKKIKNTYVIPVGEKGKYLGTITLPLHPLERYIRAGSRVSKLKQYETSISIEKLEYYGLLRYYELLQYYGLYNKIKEPAIEIKPLDERYEDSYEVEELLRTYQQILKDEELLKQVSKSYLPSDLVFIGNDDCAICHNKIFKHWEETGHASAYETLLKAEHEYDPECLACHTIGLHYFTGFETIETTPKMKGVGCESCHGPGSNHKEIQSEDYGKANGDVCITCHEDEHSPKFQFEEYWQKMAHPTEDKQSKSYK